MPVCGRAARSEPASADVEMPSTLRLHLQYDKRSQISSRFLSLYPPCQSMTECSRSCLGQQGLHCEREIAIQAKSAEIEE